MNKKILINKYIKQFGKGISKNEDLDNLVEKIGDKKIILLGEETHGTLEFYDARAYITKKLITDKKFQALTIEADWPTAFSVNRYIKSDDSFDFDLARDVLSNFKRFPQWMWCNHEILKLVQWLKCHNLSVKKAQNKIGFYGLDLYSLFESIDDVLNFFMKYDPTTEKKMKEYYNCFERFDKDTHAYSHLASFNSFPLCEKEAAAQLLEVRKNNFKYFKSDINHSSYDIEERFNVEQNAELIAAPENYYRNLFKGEVSLWNIRDEYMFSTLNKIILYLNKTTSNEQNKVIVWAHNSHIGNAKYTEMNAKYGEINLGQLIKKYLPDQCLNIGFTTYTGQVTAADYWGGEGKEMQVLPAVNGSYESIFHQVSSMENFYLDLQELQKSNPNLSALERAIGVIYKPESELISHYFVANIAQQFDYIIHYDKSSKLLPLKTDEMELDHVNQLPDTYPSSV